MHLCMYVITIKRKGHEHERDKVKYREGVRRRQGKGKLCNHILIKNKKCIKIWTKDLNREPSIGKTKMAKKYPLKTNNAHYIYLYYFKLILIPFLLANVLFFALATVANRSMYRDWLI